jgi:hypothetical protein
VSSTSMASVVVVIVAPSFSCASRR